MKRAIVCITGGIGSGKSVVSRVLRLRDIPVYDTDAKAKELMTASEELVSGIERLLGSEAFGPDGEINRPYIASKIFSDKKLRDSLNAMVHKAVRADFLEWCLRSDSQKVYMECAIPATSRLADYCTEFWLVDAPEDTRVERVMKRSGISPEDIHSRMASQKEEFSRLPEDKVRRLTNDGVTPLLPQIDALLLHLQNTIE